MKNKIKIIYEDNHLLVCEKPVNMPVQADSSGDEDLLSTVKAYINEKYSKPGEALPKALKTEKQKNVMRR